jgi:hypothetical protein
MKYHKNQYKPSKILFEESATEFCFEDEGGEVKSKPKSDYLGGLKIGGVLSIIFLILPNLIGLFNFRQ